MTDCVFCKIANHEIPADIVYEDDNVIAFLDIKPVQKGHVLIIPKSHHQWIQETPDKLIADTFILSKKLILAMKQGIDAEYVHVAVVGLEIPHFHIHLIPGIIDHGVPATFHNRIEYKNSEEEKSYQEKIKTAL